MPGQENFLWFIADEQKIRSGIDKDGNPYEVDAKTAMPSVFDGKMRQTIFAKQAFTDEFEAVGGYSTASVLNTVATPTLTCHSGHSLKQMKILTNGF